jgi:hypothetical protein
MSTTTSNRERDMTTTGQDWTAMQPEQFDTQAPLVQGALFAEPDKCGTPDLFDGDWS